MIFSSKLWAGLRPVFKFLSTGHSRRRIVLMVFTIVYGHLGGLNSFAGSMNNSDPVNEVGSPISLNDAEVMTANFRDKFVGISGAHLFGKDVLDLLTSEAGVQGVRFYHGFRQGGTLDLILVGVDGSGADLLNGSMFSVCRQCPVYCGSSNSLNDCEPSEEGSGNGNGPINSVGSPILLSDASTMTASFRNLFRGMSYGHLFGNDIILQILSEPGVEGVRFYNGLNSNGQLELIMIGVDANGVDLTNGTIADLTRECPPLCGNKNALNSSF